MFARSHHRLNRNPQKFALRDIGSEGLIFLRLFEHVVQTDIHGIQRFMERSQMLIVPSNTGYIVVEIIVVSEKLFVILIHFDIAVQRKNQPIQRGNLPDRRNRAALIQLIKHIFPFFAADLDNKLQLARILPKKRRAPDACCLRDLPHADRFNRFFHKNIERSIQNL